MLNCGTKSVYIHIPFCLKKCAYCAFLSGFDLKFKNDYTSALISEIKKFYNGEELETLYFGGGTPSLLDVSQLGEILSFFKFGKDFEITLEANPKTLDLEKLKAIKDLGINRISLGVQAFDDKLLKILERSHNLDDVYKTIENIELAGFDNFSIDLMYGLPTQDIKNWQNNLKIAKETGAKHISLYGLKIESGTKFNIDFPDDLPDDDTQADMYDLAIEELSSWQQYEFSNFAREEKYQSKHNMVYWKLLPYWGFGLGASGFVENKRYQNEVDFDKYIKNPTHEKNFEPQNEQNLLEEYIFLGFRKIQGICVEEINKRFSINFDEQYKKQLEKFLNSGHIIKTDCGYRLSKKGILVSNSIFCEFLF